MKYIYISAHKLIGATKTANSVEQLIEVFPELNGRVLLTYELDDHLFEIDRALAIGTTMLRGFVGQGRDAPPEQRLTQEIEQIRKRRGNESKSEVYLVYIAEGETDEWNPRNSSESDDFGVVFEGPNKSIIKRDHRRPIQGAVAAFALASEHICGTRQVADGIYFIDESGKPIYSLDLNMTGNMTVSTSLKDETIEYVKANAKLLSEHNELVAPSRLLAKALDENTDSLQTFLSVWAALEIFINKAFKYYEMQVFQESKLPTIPQPIIERIRSVMSDKYRITDRFSLVSSTLAIDDSAADLDEFKSIKNIRDKLMHGSDISLEDLPITCTEKMLRKYLELHVNRIRT